MHTAGYMIVLRPEALLEQYAQSYIAQHNTERLEELRRAFYMFDVTRYRGMSRDALLPYPSLEQTVIDIFVATGMDMQSDAKARSRFCEILSGPAYDPNAVDDLLALLGEAREVLSLTDDTTRWEAIHVSRPDAAPVGSLLGYDIGYWAGHFSLIADTIVIPRWHPPRPEDQAEVADALSRLNENLLFNSPAEAAEFKSFYKSNAWAETEFEGDFCIIGVCSPDEEESRSEIHRTE